MRHCCKNFLLKGVIVIVPIVTHYVVLNERRREKRSGKERGKIKKIEISVNVSNKTNCF